MAPRTCTFHYTLKDSRGQLIDTSRGGAPMPFTEGTGQIIEGLEEPLLEMAVGEKRAVIVAPERAYGQPVPIGTRRWSQCGRSKGPRCCSTLIIRWRGRNCILKWS